MDKITLTNGKKSYTLDKKDVFRSIYLAGLINYENDANNNNIDELLLANVSNKELKLLNRILKYKKRTIKGKYAEFLSNYHIEYPSKITIAPNASYTDDYIYAMNVNRKMIVVEPFKKSYDNYIYTFPRKYDLIAQVSLYFDTSAPKYDCIKSIKMICNNFAMCLFDENSFRLMRLNKLIKINKVLSYFEDGILMHRYKFIIPFWFSKNGPEYFNTKDLERLIDNCKYNRSNNSQDLLNDYVLSNYSDYLIQSKVIYNIELHVEADKIKNLCLEKQCYTFHNCVLNALTCAKFFTVSPRFEYKKIHVDDNCACLTTNTVYTKFYIHAEFDHIEISALGIKNMIMSYSQLLNNSNTLIPLIHIPFRKENLKYRNYQIEIYFDKKTKNVEVLCIIEDILIMEMNIFTKYIY